MSNWVIIIVWTVVVGAAFAFAWHQGYLRKLADYVSETQDELKKCAWPSTEELKGSTIVVLVTIVLLGGFTIGVDFFISHLVRIVL